MPELKIYPLQVGSWDSDLSVHTHLHGFGQKVKSCCYIWCILGGEKPIVVDTGCAPPEWTREHHKPMDEGSYRAPDAALTELGIKADQVELVINTHLHWDHCYHNDLFPKAAVFVQRRELQYAVAPLPAHALAYESQTIGMRPPWIKGMERMVILEGDEEIAPGVRVITLPGHSPGFQGVLVQTARGPWLIAGDTIPRRENWEGERRNKHIPSGIHVDLEEYYRTFRKMEALSAQVLPGHDPRIGEAAWYPRD